MSGGGEDRGHGGHSGNGRNGDSGDSDVRGSRGGGNGVDTPLRAAIAGKRLIQLRYKGKLRVAEPHDYGVQSRRERLLVFQLHVPGSTGFEARRARGWRLLDVAEIGDCQVLEETFPGSRGESDQKHHSWDVLYARVE